MNPKMEHLIQRTSRLSEDRNLPEFVREVLFLASEAIKDLQRNADEDIKARQNDEWFRAHAVSIDVVPPNQIIKDQCTGYAAKAHRRRTRFEGTNGMLVARRTANDYKPRWDDVGPGETLWHATTREIGERESALCNSRPNGKSKWMREHGDSVTCGRCIGMIEELEERNSKPQNPVDPDS